MIKIVLNQKRIYLTSSFLHAADILRVDSAIVSFYPSQDKISDLVDTLLISEINYLIIEDNKEACLEKFKQCFPTLLAGGGLVRNHRNDFLFIFRLKHWDLPKGKIEEGEEISLGAIREVKEETGLQEVSILDKIFCTYHMYFEDKLYLKETHWYLMHAEDQFLTPQREEGISRAVWVHPQNISFQMAKTYESVRDLFYRLGFYKRKARIPRNN
jgi:8-oxo-dGTP pyrophosphatase MutT (NUDIX family)